MYLQIFVPECSLDPTDKKTSTTMEIEEPDVAVAAPRENPDPTDNKTSTTKEIEGPDVAVATPRENPNPTDNKTSTTMEIEGPDVAVAAPRENAFISLSFLINERKNGIDDVQRETLKKAIQSGDWIVAEEFLKRHPDAVAAKITRFGETALFVAIYNGHEHIVEKLVDLMSEEDLSIQNSAGNTALVNAIGLGNYRMTACILRKNINLIHVRDCDAIPVNLAMRIGHIKLA
jgi:hypothetical protein